MPKGEKGKRLFSFPETAHHIYSFSTAITHGSARLPKATRTLYRGVCFGYGGALLLDTGSSSV